MAKRNIKREEETPVTEATVTETSAEAPATEATAAPAVETEKPPVEKPAKGLDISVTLKTSVVAILSIRVVGGQIIYNDGLHMVRQPINKGIPITITMRQ